MASEKFPYSKSSAAIVAVLEVEKVHKIVLKFPMKKLN